MDKHPSVPMARAALPHAPSSHNGSGFDARCISADTPLFASPSAFTRTSNSSQLVRDTFVQQPCGSRDSM